MFAASPREMAYFHGQQLAAVLSSAMLVLLLASPRKGWCERLFSHRVSVFLGRRCYSIYLWHWPVIWLLLRWPDWNKLAMLTLVLPLVLVLAALSYHFLERPFMRQRRQLKRQDAPPSVLAAA